MSPERRRKTRKLSREKKNEEKMAQREVECLENGPREEKEWLENGPERRRTTRTLVGRRFYLAQLLADWYSCCTYSLLLCKGAVLGCHDRPFSIEMYLISKSCMCHFSTIPPIFWCSVCAWMGPQLFAPTDESGLFSYTGQAFSLVSVRDSLPPHCI